MKTYVVAIDIIADNPQDAVERVRAGCRGENPGDQEALVYEVETGPSCIHWIGMESSDEQVPDYDPFRDGPLDTSNLVACFQLWDYNRQITCLLDSENLDNIRRRRAQ